MSVIWTYYGAWVQLIRQLQGQEGDIVGEEVPATPKKIFQLLNQVSLFFMDLSLFLMQCVCSHL